MPGIPNLYGVNPFPQALDRVLADFWDESKRSARPEHSGKASPKSNGDLAIAEDADEVLETVDNSDNISAISFLPVVMHAQRPLFDVQQALDTVRATLDPRIVFPPLVLATTYRHLLANEYMGIWAKTYTDPNGRVFDLLLLDNEPLQTPPTSPTSGKKTTSDEPSCS